MNPLPFIIFYRMIPLINNIYIENWWMEIYFIHHIFKS